MNEIDIMEENLAKLSEHFSLPTFQVDEPTNPFQKRQFGKKMKKSNVSLIEESQVRTASLPKLDQSCLRVRKGYQLPVHEDYIEEMKQSHQRSQVEDEAEPYNQEIEEMMNRLRAGIHKAEQSCKERMTKMCALLKGKQRQQQAEAMLDEIEGSIDFILNGCLSFATKRPAANKHDKENKKSAMNAGKQVKGSERQEKSIYQSVLQSRGLQKSKKRMI